jgi:hypothetical protein
MNLKDLVKTAVEQLRAQGKSELTAADICDTALQLDPTRNRRSVLGTLSGLVVGHRHPVYTQADQFLEKVGHGVYKSYQPLEKEVSKRRKRR